MTNHTTEIPAPILTALTLRKSKLELSKGRAGWFALFCAPVPGRPGPVYLAGFQPTPDQALTQLATSVQTALDPGGVLHTEMAER